MDYTDEDKNTTEKMYKGVGKVFVTYLKRFEEYDKENKETDKETINNLSKISGSLGYMAQVHAGLAKAYDHENRLAEIEKKLENSSEKNPAAWST